MDVEPVDLTRAEGTVATVGVCVAVIGEVGARAIHITTGNWWPAFAIAAVFLAFSAAFSLYLARTRRRSWRAIVAAGLPEFVRRRLRQR